MTKDKGGTKIVLKKKNNFGKIKTKAIFAVLIMAASALIVTGAAWSDGEDKVITPTYKLSWQIGDVEPHQYCSPWDEFSIIKATPYKMNFRVGMCNDLFPIKTAPHCQGSPNEINILFCAELTTESMFVFRYSPGYTGCELLEFYLDGEKIGEFCDEGGHDENNFCTFKMVEHKINLLCNPVDEKHHILTIVHKGGDGVFWDYIQLWQKHYCLEYCPCGNCVDTQCINSCTNPGCCEKETDCSDVFVPGTGFMPIYSNNFYGYKSPSASYVPPPQRPRVSNNYYGFKQPEVGFRLPGRPCD